MKNILDNELFAKFEKAAAQNDESADKILTDFMKDYIVSRGHPELVKNRWPWNNKKQKEEK